MRGFPSYASFWLIYIEMMASLFIYEDVAFGFLTKSIASHQAVHESVVLTYFLYAHITAWKASDLVLGALLTDLEHQDLEHEV